MPHAPRPTLEALPYAALDGWRADDLGAALAAFRRSCSEIMGEGRSLARPGRYGGSPDDWRAICAKAQNASSPRAFFEANFQPYLVHDAERPEGLFTGYYEPEAAGSRSPGPGYPVPIYRAPTDLVKFDETTAAQLGLRYGRIVDGKPMPYFTRAEIEQGALAGRGLELAWAADATDLFFMQVQGSGRLRLPDGGVMRLAYAAKNGLPYTAIGGMLARRGAFRAERNSMQAIRAWMADHPGAAPALMRENLSYVFFREVAVADPALGPPGAQQVNLTPERSLAVDRDHWRLGMPVWLEAQVPAGAGETMQDFRHLLIAQDTGSAIKGLARGDVFWGAGGRAAAIAGLMKARGRMVVLLPKSLAPP